MADGETIHDVVRQYQRQAKGGRSEVDFFEFVRRLESMSGRREVGKSTARRREPARFGQIPHLNFAESAVAEIVERTLPTVFVNFFGLWGPNGPMPLELTGYVYQRMHNHGDNASRRFADIVNHRFIGLYYRAWKANEQAALFDKPDGGLVAQILEALGGRSCRGARLPTFSTARWSGLFGTVVKSRDGLTTLLRSATGLPVEVRDGLESRGEIPAESRCRLGRRGVAELGRTTQLGSRFRTCTRCFEVVVGPLPYRKSVMLLPGSSRYRLIAELVHSYLDRPFDWSLRILVTPGTTPMATLDGERQLGRTLWLGRSEMSRPAPLVVGVSRLVESRRRRTFLQINK